MLNLLKIIKITNKHHAAVHNVIIDKLFIDLKKRSYCLRKSQKQRVSVLHEDIFR